MTLTIADALSGAVRDAIDYQHMRVECVLGALIASGIDMSRLARTTRIEDGRVGVMVDDREVWSGGWRPSANEPQLDWGETETPELLSLVASAHVEMMRGHKETEHG